MTFHSPYRHGFLRVAACTVPVALADPARNAAAVLDQARALHDDGVGPGSRLEYRFPDASHQPGIIQGQVMLAAALTNYARHHDVPDGIDRRPVGTSQREGWTNHLMGSSAGEWAERTLPVRTLIDTLFQRQADREHIAILWAHGRYIH